MSDVINIGDFKAKKKEEDTDIEDEIFNRVMEETAEPDKVTEYTEYKDKAAQMILEVLFSDAHNWQQNNDTTLCSWDYKDIFTKCMIKIIDMEQEHMEKEFEDMSEEELVEQVKAEIEKLREIFGEGEDTEPEGGE